MKRLTRPLWSRRLSLITLLSSLFCLLAAGHYGWVVAGPDSWGPRFACTELQFDCDEVPLDRKQIEHEFVIRNIGWQPLHITAKPGCGSCSTVKLSRNEIAPDDTAVLKVTLDFSQVKKGDFTKKVLVNTDDPALPRVVFSIKGKAV